MSSAVNEIIAHFEQANKERREPYQDTYRHPATGAEMENAVMVPVRLLKQLAADQCAFPDAQRIMTSLNELIPFVAEGEAPAAALAMRAASHYISYQCRQLTEARDLVYHFVYTGPYTGRPTDEELKQRGAAFIKTVPRPS